jgi:opacity protein-like surface antigen
MKKLVLVAVFLLGFSVLAMAQDVPMFEVFGGYSLVLVDTDTAFAQTPAEGMDLHLDGWDMNIAFNANNWAGFVVDLGGYYGTAGEDHNDTTGDETAAIHAHSLMVGPRIAMRRGVVAPFVQALFGFAHVTASNAGENVFSENDFAMALGGGLDVKLNGRVSLRPAQLDYFMVRSGQNGDFSNNFRFSTGVVVKIGKR